MKVIEAQRSIIEVEDDDDDFLSQVAAVEAQAQAHALSAKRRKLAASSESVPNPQKNVIEEGAYVSALRGSKSLLWQQSSVAKGGVIKVVAAGAGDHKQSNGGGGGVGGSCFKCGKSGHWARDCDAVVVVSAMGGSEPSVPEKKCPCGLGDCLVLTANTEKNRGRKFYKCPVREENGGCGFFEWCDSASGTNSLTGGTQSYVSNVLFPDLPCPCGSGRCLILTAKTAENIGRQFYRCPANQGSSCGFFKWCNDPTEAVSLPLGTSKVYINTNDTSNKSHGIRAGSSCFKCGKEGHWAKDCHIPSSDYPAEVGRRSASSGICYKCSKVGHLTKDCTSSRYMNVQQKH